MADDTEKQLDYKTRVWIGTVALAALVPLFHVFFNSSIGFGNFDTHFIEFITSNGLIFWGDAVMLAAAIDYAFAFRFLFDKGERDDLSKINIEWGITIGFIVGSLLLATYISSLMENGLDFPYDWLAIGISGLGFLYASYKLAFNLKRYIFKTEGG